MSDTRTKVIIINGAPQSGKDTFVELARKYCDENEYANILNLSSVDLIKGALMEFGWNGKKTDDVRDIIADIKKIWISAQNGPTMFMMNNILDYHKQHMGEDNIVFCHIREPEEIKKLVDIIRGMDTIGIEVLTMIIIRENQGVIADKSVRYSDDPEVIAYYPYDMRIYNNSSLTNYYNKVCRFMDDLLD